MSGVDVLEVPGKGIFFNRIAAEEEAKRLAKLDGWDYSYKPLALVHAKKVIGWVVIQAGNGIHTITDRAFSDFNM